MACNFLKTETNHVSIFRTLQKTQVSLKEIEIQLDISQVNRLLSFSDDLIQLQLFTGSLEKSKLAPSNDVSIKN